MGLSTTAFLLVWRRDSAQVSQKYRQFLIKTILFKANKLLFLTSKIPWHYHNSERSVPNFSIQNDLKYPEPQFSLMTQLGDGKAEKQAQTQCL